jgi:hypothetical protein
MNTPSVSNHLVMPLRIDAWVIADGNYPDLRVGQEFECAICFGGVDTLAATDRHEISLTQANIKTGCFDVVARVLHADEDIYVIDFGLLAYTRDTGYEIVERNAFVTGNVGFSVDPYAYREFWSKRLGIPMIYRWRIERILELRPYRTFQEYCDGKVFHDDSNWHTVDVDSTKSSIETENYHPSWELFCMLLSPEARLSRPDESIE